MANEPNSGGARKTGGDGASDVLGQAQQVIGGMAGQVGDQVATRIEGQKNVLSDGLMSVAVALRKASDQLRAEKQPTAPEAIEAVAARVERLADYLGERTLGDIVNDSEEFARRNPLVVVGGAFVAGLLATRFLKASARRARTVTRGASRAPQARTGRRTGTTGD